MFAARRCPDAQLSRVQDSGSANIGLRMWCLPLLLAVGSLTGGCSALAPENLLKSQPKADMSVPYPPTTFRGEEGEEAEVPVPGLNRPIGAPDQEENDSQGQTSHSASSSPMGGGMGGDTVDVTPRQVTTDTDVTYGANGPSNVAGQQ
ncbi:hypothetical protein [Oecophyllibacter saccharovorans]|uniref:hypothetical protein n=1 Tax=Oecophyllibacter saccharovorans TaxID=2558360 RepID=UPI001172DB51|nr:hypothetical protein [Oecophyllibacter saccharovorans]TPW36316.1 hypothetical protein E3203_00510 [Oecophyllibacter saccharovorans]